MSEALQQRLKCHLTVLPARSHNTPAPRSLLCDKNMRCASVKIIEVSLSLSVCVCVRACVIASVFFANLVNYGIITKDKEKKWYKDDLLRESTIDDMGCKMEA